MTKKLTIKVRVQESNIDDMDESENLFNLPNNYDSELFILQLQDHRLVQLLLLRFLGYDYKEITKVMKLRNIGEFYFLWSKLKDNFEKHNKS